MDILTSGAEDDDMVYSVSFKYLERDGSKSANEYGQAAVRSIYGVEILNEGSGASMDDIVIEESMTFIARELGPMYATGQPRDGVTDFTGWSSDINPGVFGDAYVND